MKFSVKAQWVHSQNLSYWDNSFLNCNWNFDDAIFSSQDSGMFTGQCFISPTQGYHNQVICISDSGSILPTGNPFNGVGIGLYYSAPQTYYYLYYQFQAPVNDILKSTDFGASWHHLFFLNYYSMSSFSSPDSSIFFITSRNDILIRCIHEIYDTAYVFNNEKTGSIFFTDSLNGFIAVSDSSTLNTCHRILKSNTGGTSWSNSFDDSSFNINKLFFLSTDKGFAAGDNGKIIKTINSGITWQNINTGYNGKLNDILFMNDTLGYAAGTGGFIAETANGGLTWTQQTLFPPDSENVTKLMKVSESNIYALVGNHIYSRYAYPDDSLIINKDSDKLLFIPNPAQKSCDILMPEDFWKEKNLDLRIFGSTGKMIMQQTLQINNGKAELNLEKESEGIYYVVVNNGEKILTGKLCLINKKKNK